MIRASLTLLISIGFLITFLSYSISDVEMVRVKGSIKAMELESTTIHLYNVKTDKEKEIERLRNKFDFLVPIDNRFILTVKDHSGKGKSIYINTLARNGLSKKQQFILIVDLTKKPVAIPKGKSYGSKCDGIIKYSRKNEKFYYVRKEVTYDQIKEEIAIEKAEMEAKD